MNTQTNIGKGWEKEIKIITRPPFYTKVSDTEVFQTTLYEKFKCDDRNRPVSEEKINFFMRQFKAGKFFMYEFPLIVDKHFVILDGQHRFEAVKRLELPLYFRFAKDLSIESVIDVQINAGWTNKDYLHAYIKQGKQDYIVLNRFVNRYKFSMTVACIILSGRSSGGLKKSGFYEGSFKVLDETKSHEQAKLILELGELAFNLHTDRSFCLAIIYIIEHPEWDKKRMIDQITKYGSLIRRQVNADGYMKNLEEVFNYKLYTKNKVRFI